MLRLEAMLVSNKERNYPNLKNTIDSDFDKVKNYNSIMAKIDALNEKSLDEKNNTNKKGIAMKKLKPKYIYSIVSVALIAIFAFGFINNKINLDVISSNKAGKNDTNIKLNINKPKNESMSKIAADLAAEDKSLKLENLPNKFNFMRNIDIPKDYKLASCSTLYTASSLESDTYDLLHDYIFDYEKSDEENITVTFSEVEEPLRDCFVESENAKKISKIHGTDVVITELGNTYTVTFKHNNIYFDIETHGISQDELVKMLVSIIDSDNTKDETK